MISFLLSACDAQIPYALYFALSNAALQLLVMELPLGLFVLFILVEF